MNNNILKLYIYKISIIIYNAWVNEGTHNQRYLSPLPDNILKNLNKLNKLYVLL